MSFGEFLSDVLGVIIADSIARNKWIKRILLLLAAVVLIGLVGLFIYLFSTRR